MVGLVGRLGMVGLAQWIWFGRFGIVEWFSRFGLVSLAQWVWFGG